MHYPTAQLDRPTAPATAAFSGPSLIESLEGRRLLSAWAAVATTDVAAASAAGFDQSATAAATTTPRVAGFYLGTLSFARQAGQPRRVSRDAFVTVTSVDATGAIAGTINAAGVNAVSFTGQVGAGNAVTLTLSGGLTGTLTGRFKAGGKQLSGLVADTSNATVGRLRVRSLTPVGQFGAVDGTTADGAAAAAAGLNFLGTAAGATSLRQALDAAAADQTLTAGRLPLDLSLDITGQTANGGLTGTLTSGGTTYDLTGVAAGRRIVLVATPPAGVGGSVTGTDVLTTTGGVLSLRSDGAGNLYSGTFQQGGVGVFGTGRVSLARDLVDGTASGGITGAGASAAGSLGGTGSVLADGSVVQADGSLLRPDGTVAPGSGVVIGADGSIINTSTGATPIGSAGSVLDGFLLGQLAGGGIGGISAGGPASVVNPVGTPASTGSAIGTPTYVSTPAGGGFGAGGAGGVFATGSTSAAGQLVDSVGVGSSSLLGSAGGSSFATGTSSSSSFGTTGSSFSTPTSGVAMGIFG